MTKKKEKITEWVAFDSDEDVPYEDYVENCKDNDREPDAEGSDAYWQYVRDTQEMFHDDFRANMKCCKLFPMVATGYAGLWYGQVAGGKVLHNVDDMLSMFSECDRVKIWQDKDGFHMNGYHHDGTNSVDIRILNNRGKAWLEKNEENASRRELCETLSKPCFSRSFPMGKNNNLF